VAVYLLLVAAATLAVFLPVAGHDFVIYDDLAYVAENPRVAAGLSLPGVLWALTSLEVGNWHPLTWISHMADVSLHGMDAGRHHLTSLILHLLISLLLLVALRSLTGRTLPAALAAILFAVHPLRVESVAWLAERKDVLCGLFWMASLAAWTRYVRCPAPGRYLAAWLTVLLALAAKPMAVTLPFVLLLLDWWPLGRHRLGGGGAARALLLEKGPLLLLAAGSSLLTLAAQGRVEALFPLEVLGWGARTGNALVSIVRYLGKTLVPTGLAFHYPLRPGGPPPSAVLVSLTALAAVSLAAWRLRRRAPWLLTGWLLFAGTLVPVLGLVQVGSQALADRYTYLPLTGIFLAAAWGFDSLTRRGGSSRLPALSLAAVLILLLAVRARDQVRVWRDDETLLSHAASVVPGDRTVMVLTALAHDRRGRTDQAVAALAEAGRVFPEDPEIPYLAGRSLLRAGRRGEAVGWFREAVRLHPGNVTARFTLGLLEREGGEAGAAADQFAEAVRLKPDFAEGFHQLGISRTLTGDLAGAEAALREAVRLEPGHREAAHNLGVVLEEMGREGEAAEFYRRAGTPAGGMP
jgi:Flp pilus assembly protein TadD